MGGAFSKKKKNNAAPSPVKGKEGPSCCPTGSEPKLAANYTPKGTTQNLGDLPVYTVGQGDKAILIISDIFGPDGGRTKLICDQLADAGFLVVLPDLFKGDFWKSEDFNGLMDWFPKYMWNNLEDNFAKHIYPFLETKGVKSTGIVGFCWGVYVAFHASESGKFKAGVGFHPTLDKFPESAQQLAELVACPYLLVPAGNDPDIVKEGGDVEKILKAKPFGDKVQVQTFPDVNHGWMPRGDINQPEVANRYKEGMELAIKYFKENL